MTLQTKIPKKIRNQAEKLLNALIDGAQINPKGFRAVRTSRKRQNAIAPIPSIMERLATVAFPEESSLPKQERSARGLRKLAGRQTHIKNLQDYQSRLNTYRQMEGVSKFAKKLPSKDWEPSEGVS